MPDTIVRGTLERRVLERRAVLYREIELAERDASGRHEQRVRAAVCAVDDALFLNLMATLERS